MTLLPILFTIAESAHLARTGQSTVYAAIASGELESVKRGRHRLIRREVLARWLGVPEKDLVAASTPAA